MKLTPKEIEEGNAVIAEFMGLLACKSPYDGAYTTSDENSSFNIFFNGLLEDESWYEHPKFYNDWNWIMYAWIKFRDTTSVEQAKQGLLTNLVASLASAMPYIEVGEFFKRLARAIKWYNLNKS